MVADLRPELHRYCARLTGSVIEGEDIVQETLARAFYSLSLKRPRLIARRCAEESSRAFESSRAHAAFDDPSAQTRAPRVRARRYRGRGGSTTRRPRVTEERASIGKKLAETFRNDLLPAGVDRQQLFERTPERQPIRVHDQRASFVTRALACGRTEAWLTDRTGHKSSAMIARYKRSAPFAAS
jgi:hypothetical protein